MLEVDFGELRLGQLGTGVPILSDHSDRDTMFPVQGYIDERKHSCRCPELLGFNISRLAR